MLVTPSSVNMEKLKDENFELYRLFVVVNKFLFIYLFIYFLHLIK